jgi:hypothetical protein
MVTELKPKEKSSEGKSKTWLMDCQWIWKEGQDMGSTGEPASIERHTRRRTKVYVSHFITIFILLLSYYTSPSAPVGSGKSSMLSFLPYFTKPSFPFQYDFIYRVVKEIFQHPASFYNLCLQFRSKYHNLLCLRINEKKKLEELQIMNISYKSKFERKLHLSFDH